MIHNSLAVWRDYNIIVYMANVISFDWRLSIDISIYSFVRLALYCCCLFPLFSFICFVVWPFFSLSICLFCSTLPCYYVWLCIAMKEFALAKQNQRIENKAACFWRSEKSKLVFVLCAYIKKQPISIAYSKYYISGQTLLFYEQKQIHFIYRIFYSILYIPFMSLHHSWMWWQWYHL